MAPFLNLNLSVEKEGGYNSIYNSLGKFPVFPIFVSTVVAK